MSPKRIRQQSITGMRGMTLVQDVLLEIGFVVYPTGDVEAGTDAFMEIRDAESGDVTNLIIQIQSKATEGQFEAETHASFVFRCDQKDLNYWLLGNVPFILVVSRPATRDAFWVSIKDYFDTPEKRKTGKIVFDKGRDRFDVTCGDALIKLAMPADSGLYFAPQLKNETLYSNLLRVSYYPEDLFVAQTPYRKAEDLRAELKARDIRDENEWLLKNKSLFSFRDLDREPWPKFCDIGTLEKHNSKAWSLSDDPERKRDFVQLLNHCLRSKARSLGLWWSKDQKCYFFKPSDDLSTKSLSCRSIANETSRDVFRAYYKFNKPDEIAFYRHSAFKSGFSRYEGEWFMEITPTYYFTRDGRDTDGFYEERLKKMKEIEDNPAVLGQVIMWAEYLGKHGAGDLFVPTYPYLEFDKLETFDVEVGINDKSWLPRERKKEADESNHQENVESEDSWLF